MSSRKSKPKKNNQDFNKERRKQRIYSLIVIIVCLIIGIGIIVDNISEIYMMDKNTASINAPHKIMKGRENVFLITTYTHDGLPAKDKEVTVDLKYGDDTYNLYSGKTDSSGSVQPVFEVPDIGNEGDRAQLVIKAGSEKIIKEVILDTTTKIFISTDKPIYQLSQEIHMRALCFKGSLPLTEKDSVQVEIMDPDMNKIFKELYTPNDYGIINVDFTLLDQLSLGNYKIIVSAKGASELKNVLVKEYVLPKFKIEVEDIRNWYTINENISGNVSCNYFFGKEIDGEVNIEIRAYYGIWENVYNIKGTLKKGRFAFAIPRTEYAVGLPYNSDNGYLEMNITVKDASGHEETKTKMISIARKPIILTLVADSNIVGTESNHFLLSRYPDGTPISNAKVEYWLDNYNYYNNKKNTFSTVSDNRGIAEIDFIFNNQRYLMVEVSDEETTVKEQYYITGSKGLKVISDKTYYDVGQVANMNVNYNGDKGVTKWVYYDVISKGFVVTTGHLKLNENNEGSFKLAITPEMSPLAEIRVYKTQKDLNMENDIVIIGVGSSDTGLNVNISTNKELYTPNDDITFYFSVSDQDIPVQAALGLAFVDQSVFEINERFTGLERIIQDLEQDFITPQYQICNYVYSPKSPVSSIPGESNSVVSQRELSVTGKGKTLVVTGTTHLDYANQLEDYYEHYYWFVLMFIALISLLCLFVLALKYKKVAGLLIIMMVILPTFMGIGMYIWTSSISNSDNDISGGNGITGEMEELDTWWDGGEDDNFPESPRKKSASGASADYWEREEPGLDLGISDVNLPDLPEDNGGYYKIETTQTSDIFKPVQTRRYFPETWYWNPSLITNEKGIATLSLTTPDTMTTWNVEAVASTKNARFGLGTKNVTVFKGFFIEPDIPVSVLRNDEFPLKILIYNYANHTSSITIKLHSGEWFELLSESNGITTQVSENNVSSVEFRIRPKEVGKFKITVDGDNGHSIDRVIKDIRIDPDGKAIEEIINGALENNQTVEETIEFLDKRISNSTNAYVKLQGGTEAITLDGAENYINFVSGCGEQSTSKLSVDIAAYKNLLKGDLTDEKLFEYEQIIAQGIEHELMYLIEVPSCNGKSIVWHGSGPPDLWLTAWASFAFKDLIDVGFNVDENMLEGFQNYLVSTQENDGSYSFPNLGHWSINSKLQNEKLASTAYITRALLYMNYSKNSNTIKKSVTYLENNVDLDDDPFTLALVLLTLDQAKNDKSASNILANTLTRSKQESSNNNTVWWTWIKTDRNEHFRHNSKVIETTGYAIMALYNHYGYSDIVRKAVNFLITERSGGCFGSTHDTAVAFQALNTVGEIRINNLEVDVFVEIQKIESIRFNDFNKDVTYLIDLRPYIHDITQQLKVTLISQGDGSIFYQIFNEQYLPWNETYLFKPPELELKVTYNTTKIKVNDKIKAEVYLRYNGSSDTIKMILIDLRAPVGFSFIENDFKELLNQRIIDNYEIIDRQALVYIDNVKKGIGINFTYTLLANNPIKGTIQGVHAYDMYDPNIDTELGPVEIQSFN
jgi:hypothetical protein